jgi:hypothetical protein
MAGKEEKKQPKRLNVQVDSEDYDEFAKKAGTYGTLSDVIRAMIRTFIKGERNFDITDLEDVRKKPGRPPKDE